MTEIKTEIWDTHERVFHYTTQAGLQGILESRSLHATHYKFLNDAQEMKQLMPRLIAEIKPVVQKLLKSAAQFQPKISEAIKNDGGLQAVAQKEASAIARGLYKATFEMHDIQNFYEPFVISFCEHGKGYEADHGLLSQWRAYGGGQGYAIAFNAKKLCELAKDEAERYAYNSIHFSDVVYDDNEEAFEAEFKPLIEELAKAVSQLYKVKLDQVDLTSLFGPFINSATRYKHRAFKEEREVRLVLPPISQFWANKLDKDQPEQFVKIKGKEIKRLKFKPGLVPYIEITSSEALPIEYIIVGPSRNRESNAEKLLKFAEMQEVSTRVLISDTPLIS